MLASERDLVLFSTEAQDANDFSRLERVGRWAQPAADGHGSVALPEEVLAGGPVPEQQQAPACKLANRHHASGEEAGVEDGEERVSLLKDVDLALRPKTPAGVHAAALEAKRARKAAKRRHRSVCHLRRQMLPLVASR